jgi:hypothetical protein
MRNRFFWGELTRQLQPFYDTLGRDPGFFDLSILWTNGESYALHTVFDRMFFIYERNNLELSVGRQRINWAMTFIWNPNDLFNTYSFFDFDYEERPGSDAIQLNYYSSYTSQAGVVYELGDSLQSSKLAARYRWNTNTYDIQLLGGYQARYYVLGFGWAGDIKGAGFRGEGSYFIPEQGLNAVEQFVGAVDLDYAFSNRINLMVQASYLFNSLGLNERSGDYTAFYLDRTLSAQTLSPAKHNVFLQSSGQLSPIINTSLAAMINPSDGSAFIGPTLDWSVVENFDILLAGQFFRGRPSTLYGDGGSFLFMRFKYSF